MMEKRKSVMTLKNEWAQVRAGKETEKLSVSGQAIEKGLD